MRTPDNQSDAYSRRFSSNAAPFPTASSLPFFLDARRSDGSGGGAIATSADLAGGVHSCLAGTRLRVFLRRRFGGVIHLPVSEARHSGFEGTVCDPWRLAVLLMRHCSLRPQPVAGV